MEEGYWAKGATRLAATLVLSLGLHAGLVALWWHQAPPILPRTSPPHEPIRISLVDAVAPAPADSPRTRASPPDRSRHPAPRPRAHPAPPRAAPPLLSLPPPPAGQVHPLENKVPASMAAPAAPTDEEWQKAATYTLKNSKRYRYDWGQTVRSRMGTAVEGPQQGLVRFHIEIAPDGKLAKVEELWSTTTLGSKLAWQAIRSLPPLPPTPTGKPLVFEQTISFEPFDAGWPPNYSRDCVADPPSFRNPFAWDGSSPEGVARPSGQNTAPPDSAPAPGDCPTDARPDSIETESGDIKRQLDQWSVERLNGAK